MAQEEFCDLVDEPVTRAMLTLAISEVASEPELGRRHLRSIAHWLCPDSGDECLRAFDEASRRVARADVIPRVRADLCAMECSRAIKAYYDENRDVKAEEARRREYEKALLQCLLTLSAVADVESAQKATIAQKSASLVKARETVAEMALRAQSTPKVT